MLRGELLLRQWARVEGLMVQVGQAFEGSAAARERPGFNKGVHGARGLFALLVFVFHVVNSGLATVPALRTPLAEFILRTPEYGVELFFCISGYVITGTLRRAASPAAFLEDRAIRIYPVLGMSVLAIVALGLATGVHGYAVSELPTLAWTVPLNMLGLPGVLPLDNIHPAAWSLSYELAFYAFCAACWAVRRRLGAALPWVAGPIGLVALVFYPRALFLLAGMLVALGWPRHPALVRVTRHPLLLIVLFLVCWRTIQTLSLPKHIISTTMLDWAADARLPIAVAAFLFATLGFAGLAAGHGRFVAVLRTRPLQYLGTISYSFYLWHPIVMSGVKTVLLRLGATQAAGEGAQLLFFVVALPPSILAADASQRILERRVAVWLRGRLRHPPPMQPRSLEPGQASTPTLERT